MPDQYSQNLRSIVDYILNDFNYKNLNTLMILGKIYKIELEIQSKKFIKSESEKEKVKMETLSRAIMKLQTSFITQNKQNQYDIKKNIKYVN